jgi:hypothetical protein
MILQNADSSGEYVLTRYYDDTDRDLGVLALRYGMSSWNALLVFDGDYNPHWQGRAPTHAQVEERILASEPFALRIPDDERRYQWGTYENATGREVTLGDAVREINNRPTQIPQPVVDADLLWSYAVNADMRARVLHDRTEGERHTFDDDPARARLPSGTQVRFPVVTSVASRPVCVASGCSVPLSPTPAWLPSYYHQIAEIERLARRLDVILRHIERLQQEGAAQLGRIDFVKDLLDRVQQDVHAREGRISPTLADVQRAVDGLRRQTHHYMVEQSVREHRSLWFQDLERVSRLLLAILGDHTFLWRHEMLMSEGQHLGVAGVMNDANMSIAQAINMLTLTDSAAARTMAEASLRFLDGQQPSESDDNVVILFIRRWSLLWSAGPVAIANTPGPPSIAGAIFTMQMLYSLRSPDVPRDAMGRRQGLWRRMLLDPITEVEQQQLERALTTGNIAQRQVAGFRVYQRALGTGANALATAFALLGLVAIVTDEDTSTNAWQVLGRDIAITNGVVSTGFSALAFQGSQNLARSMLGRVFPALRAPGAGLPNIGNIAGYTLGILAVVQGLYQLGDYYFQTDSADRRYSTAIAGWATLAGGIVTIAATAMAIPWLQIAGIVLAIGALVAGAWPHDADNLKALVEAQIRTFEQRAIDPTPNDAQWTDSMMGGSFGNQSFYRMVTGDDENHHSTHGLATALHVVLNALRGWSGHTLIDNAANRQYLERHGFDTDQIAAITD